MEIRDIYYFQAVAEYGHMGQAAKSLFLSQPALTKAIHRLEESIGAPLLIREGRRIALTELGKLLLQRTYTLRQHIDDTTREVRGYAQGQSGLIRLGCSPTMAKFVLPEIIADLLRQAPGVRIDLYTTLSGELLAMLKDGVLDLVFTPVSGPLEGYEVTPMINDDLVIVGGKNHPIFNGEYTVRDLARYNWVLPKYSAAPLWLNAMLAKHGCPPAIPQVTASSILYLPRLIVEANLLSVLSLRNINHADNGGLLRVIDLPEARLRRVFGLVHAANGYISPGAQRLVTLLREKHDDDVPDLVTLAQSAPV